MEEKIKLSNILDEISVGAHNNDEISKKLKKYINEVKASLLKLEITSTIDNRKISFEFLDIFSRDDNYSNNLFFQGSYGTNTAIKIKECDVDADIGIILSGTNDSNVRKKIYSHLTEELSNYSIDLKSPCITITCEEDFHIDIAVYLSFDNKLFYVNSINSEQDKLEEANPKGFIQNVNKTLSNNSSMRSIIRLFKYFVKTTNEKFDVNHDNRIPSISILLHILNESIIDHTSEEDLIAELMKCVDNFLKFVEINGLNGPQKNEYFIGNTFYKIKDINEVTKVLKTIKLNLSNKHYSQLVSSMVFEKLKNKSVVDKTPSLIGTMG